MLLNAGCAAAAEAEAELFAEPEDFEDDEEEEDEPELVFFVLDVLPLALVVGLVVAVG